MKCRDRTAARPTADGYAGFGEAALRIANREIAAMKVRGAGFLPSAADPYATIVGPERPAEPHGPAARDQSHVLDRIGRADKLDENSSVMGPYKLLQQIGHGEGHSFHCNAATHAEASSHLCLNCNSDVTLAQYGASLNVLKA